jgi:hypothetical protein
MEFHARTTPVITSCPTQNNTQNNSDLILNSKTHRGQKSAENDEACPLWELHCVSVVKDAIKEGKICFLFLTNSFYTLTARELHGLHVPRALMQVNDIVPCDFTMTFNANGHANTSPPSYQLQCITFLTLFPDFEPVLGEYFQRG